MIFKQIWCYQDGQSDSVSDLGLIADGLNPLGLAIVAKLLLKQPFNQ